MKALVGSVVWRGPCLSFQDSSLNTLEEQKAPPHGVRVGQGCWGFVLQSQYLVLAYCALSCKVCIYTLPYLLLPMASPSYSANGEPILTEDTVLVLSGGGGVSWSVTS